MNQYVVFYKPFGVLSQFTPELEGQRTLAEFNLPEGLYAAGRLDSDSEGLLLLTDDGPLIKLLLAPGSHNRTYLAQVEGTVTPAELAPLKTGVVIGDYKTLPASALVIEPPIVPDRDPPIRTRKSIPTSWIELRIKEGKNRQVRKMSAAIGHPTLRLIRTSIACITLASISPGSWRYLDPSEISALKHEISDATHLTLKKRGLNLKKRGHSDGRA